MLLDLSATHTEYQVTYVINRAAFRHRFDLDATLHTHHDSEDSLLWDKLEQRAPACAR